MPRNEDYDPWDDIQSGQLFDPDSDQPLQRINQDDISEYVYDRGIDKYGNDYDEEYVQDLLDKGWFDTEGSYEDRFGAREELFDYMDWDVDEFPWELWREWYSEG